MAAPRTVELKRRIAESSEHLVQMRDFIFDSFQTAHDELIEGLATERAEMNKTFAALRGEMTEGLAAVRGEMTGRFDRIDATLDRLLTERVPRRRRPKRGR